MQGLKPTVWLISVQMRSRRRPETGAIGCRQARLLKRLKYKAGDSRQKTMSAIKEGVQIKSFQSREKQVPLKGGRTKFHVWPGRQGEKTSQGVGQSKMWSPVGLKCLLSELQLRTNRSLWGVCFLY